MYKKISDHLWEMKMEWEYLHEELRYVRHYLPDMEDELLARITLLDRDIQVLEGIITKIIKVGIK